MTLWVAVLVLAWGCHTALGRKHSLTIQEDRRQFIPLSTFGFYTGGKLQVKMAGFHVTGRNFTELSQEMILGFSIDKTVSDALNPYVQATETQCILNKVLDDKEKAGILRFTLDFTAGKTKIKCSKNIRSITILESDNQEAEISMGPRSLSDSEIFRPKRSFNDPDAGFSVESAFEGKLDRQIKHYYEGFSPSFHPTSTSRPATNFDSELSNNVKVNKPSAAKTEMKKEELKVDITNKAAVKVEAEDDDFDKCEEIDIPLKLDPDGYYQTSFVIYISDEKQEGLYSMFFHNCYNYLHRARSKRLPVNFNIKIEEKNSDSFLSAGEMPLPALYQMLSILFFLSGCFWVFILKKNGTEQVFRIHWVMASLVFLKSLSLFFHGVNYTKIATNGIHEESWAILYYVTHLLKGGLLFFTIVLIGSGWAFVKHVLSSNEKKVFMVVLPAQVISNVAYIILEESEQGEIGHNFWKEVFVLIDLVCCGAILLPVVWSIKHLQDASSTDGKAAVSLEKLKLFRHFYIMVVCYVYFTRIIVYLLKITVPFQYEWLDSMFKEVATLVFFVMTGYKFRPACNNPYFAVSRDDDMEEVLISSSAYTEQVTSRKYYKPEDMDDEEENVVLFSRDGEMSHDLD